MTGVPVYLAAASTGDALALEALEKRCSSHPWTKEQFAGAIRGGAGERVVLLRTPAATLAGYCVWQEVADEMHIHNIAIAPERRRQRLGRRLLATCLGLAAGRRARRAFLDVRARNVSARRLYRSLGFREVGLRTRYYSDPVEDALLLEASLDPVALRGILKSGEAAC